MDAQWGVQAGGSGGATVAGKCGRSVARHGGDDSCCGGHAPDALVAGIANIEVARCVEGNIGWAAKPCLRGGTTVPTESREPTAGYEGDRLVGRSRHLSVRARALAIDAGRIP